MWLLCKTPLFSFVLGGPCAGSAVWLVHTHEYFVPTEEREMDESYTYISPLLSCGIETVATQTGDVLALRANIDAYLTTERREGDITEGAVYYRELHDGAWFGIGETLTFTPGSLLKVPLALSIERKRQDDPTFGVEPILYEGGALEVPQSFPSPETATSGNAYTVDELLRLVLVHSDNIATQILANLIDRDTLNAAYTDLGITVPESGDSYTMTVRTYASFFRILYNATYVSHAASERLLSLLAQSSFAEGLRSGVPPEVAVAHKFGERTHEAGESAQLHDCGIVYREGAPYVLCVMLRGKDMTKLPAVIAEISRRVYEGTRQ